MNFAGIACDLAACQKPAILVHGANACRDELAVALHREKTVVTSVSGYSSVLSDDSAIDLLMMAYAGLQNKRLVAACQRHGVNAVGLSGLDGRAVRGRRNRGIRIREGDRIRILRDRSGKPESVNVFLLSLLVDNGFTPVLTMPILDESAEAINSENDDVVALLHREFNASVIVQLIEAPGFLRDPSDPSSVIAALSPADILAWEQRSEGRIQRKLHAIGKLFAAGSPTVIVADGRTDHPLRDALAGRGTVIRRETPPGETRP